MISKIRDGDKKAFEMLMSGHLKVIYNYISAHVGDEEAKKEIVQETMLSIWQGLERFNGNSAFRTWCIGITRRKIADHYRGAYNNAAVPLSEVEDSLCAEDALDSVNIKLAVEKSITTLSQADKDLLFLVFNAQLTYAEISEMTGIPIGSIKSRMSMLKSKLKKQLETGGWT